MSKKEEKDFSKLSRKINSMPSYMEEALRERKLMDDYLKRPPYQQNDYIGWIEKAKRDDTRLKRLNQMLEELDTGGIYMKMEHKASKK